VRRIVLIMVMCLPLLGLPDLAPPLTAAAAGAATAAAHWKFDEGQGTVAADGSGHQHDAVLTGGASWGPGRDRTLGATVNGAGAFADAGAPVIDTTRSFTVMAWARFDATTGFHTVMGVDGDRVSGFYLQSRGDDGRFAFTRLTSDSTTTTHVRAEASAGPQPGTWYHLAGVYDAAAREISLYVNGQHQETVAFTTPWRATGHLTIGRGQWAGAPADYVDGTIDDVRAYQAALTAEALKGFADRPALAVDASAHGPALRKEAYGLSLEETSHSGDGGLYAELVRNRTLKESDTSPAHWSAVTGGDARGSIALDRALGPSAAIGRSLRVGVDRLGPGGRVGAANDGYWGVALKPRTTYKADLQAMATSGFTGRVVVSLEGADGHVVARAVVPGITRGRWKRHQVSLTTPAAVPSGSTGRIVVAAESPCRRGCRAMSGEALWLSAVSLMPPTYKGHGLRADVMRRLAALRPGLLRVPGGDHLEAGPPGTRFTWKDTIGPVWERPGHHDSAWGSWSTDGAGLLEYLRMAEDLGAEPVLTVYAGYSSHGTHVPAGELGPYVQDALDEIEYATGPVTSRWGAKRARDGHPEPFRIRYVEVGDEDWFDSSGSYEQRYAAFCDAIRRKYPRVEVVASTRVNSRPADVIDDHYENSPSWFAGNAGRYDAADRSGPKVLVGEYSALEGSPTGTLAAGLGEAGFLTGLERNADVVVGSMHAPLVVNEHAPNRRTNLIGLDAATSYGSPSYQVQRMFAEHRGDHVVTSVLSGGDPGLRTVVTRAGREVHVKVVNESSIPQRLTVEVAGGGPVARTGTATVLAGDPALRNTLTEPELISPRAETLDGLGRRFEHTFPAYSFTILTLTVGH
jgi:alpha-L-arabinofuranosidase